MDALPNPVPCSGTTTDEKARIFGLQPEEQVKRSNFRPRDSHPGFHRTADR